MRVATIQAKINHYSVRSTKNSDINDFISFAEHQLSKGLYFINQQIIFPDNWAKAMVEDIPNVSRYILENHGQNVAFFNLFTPQNSVTFLTLGVFPNFLGRFTGVAVAICAIKKHFNTHCHSLYGEISKKNTAMIRIAKRLGARSIEIQELGRNHLGCIGTTIALKMENQPIFIASANKFSKRLGIK